MMQLHKPKTISDPPEDLMGKSGNPALKAIEASGSKPGASKISDFKKGRQGIFELPSGLYMKLRNPGGLKVFLADGIIPNSLMSIVTSALEGKKPSTEDLIDPKVGVDPQMVDDMMSLVNHIMVACAVDPKVYDVPEDEDDRDEELLYADELDDQDKMFVFQWVSGGTTDLEYFRQRYTQDVATLGGSIPMGLQSE
jgi:hypothetical protein